MLAVVIVGILAANSVAAPTDPPQTPPDVASLIDLARAVPSEFSSDILLRIACSPLVTGPNRKRELLEEAFTAAARAPWPYKRRGGVHTDTRESRAAWDNGLDAMSLQLRAVTAMLPLDPRRALAMFLEIRLDGLAGFTCRDALIPDVSRYYETLPMIFERAFTPKERKEGIDLHFVERAIRTVTSPVQVAPAGSMLFALPVAPGQRQRLMNAFAATLDTVPANHRLLDPDENDTVAIALQASRAGLDLSALIPALRSYLVRTLGAPRCSRPHRSDPPSFPADFNALIKRLNAAGADYSPISEEEQRPLREGGVYQVTDYWQSPRSKQVLEDLRWLTHGNRDLPGDRRFWTLEERSTNEWNARYLELLKLIEGWKEEEEASAADYFHMKASTFRSLADLLPPGRPRDNALLAFLSFLEQSYESIGNRNEWFTELQFLLPRTGRTKDPPEAAYFLDEMARSRNSVISLYAGVEKLLRGPRSPAPAAAPPPRSPVDTPERINPRGPRY